MDPTRPSSETSARAQVDPDNRLHAISALSTLLDNLEETAPHDKRHEREQFHQNQLVLARTGVASSLFRTMQAKHPPTAAHCLRVALGCSAWSMHRKMDDRERDLIEIAALLHDIGKVGVPDHVLLKPGKLLGEELLTMERHTTTAVNILGECCGAPEILDLVRYSGAWFNGEKAEFDLAGEDIPLGARMIAIVDAFDSMTTDHVYRRALSRERATAELFECGETQFDLNLVHDFGEFLAHESLNDEVARRWLHELSDSQTSGIWTRASHPTVVADPSQPSYMSFHRQMLEGTRDGVIFADSALKILMWNRSMEQLTGVSPESIEHQLWDPSALHLRNDKGIVIQSNNCPLSEVLATGTHLHRRFTIRSASQEDVSVDFSVIPVTDLTGQEIVGVVAMLRDASNQITLEQRLETLHERATRDPLTKVSNRAEFDRALGQFVESHLAQSIPCSLIICDIDHFKKINDTYGHQAGDDALVAFAALLNQYGEPGDLVARYGGEEFVLLCASTDNGKATRRAEDIRRQLSDLPQPALNGRCITASFGVTELQLGDTPETMLRRADRALMQAKDNGRNMVVQLGSGMGQERTTKPKRSWLSMFNNSTPGYVVDQIMTTAVPINMTAEKLRGFVADQGAEIVSIEENQVTLRMDDQTQATRRSSDRPVPFFVELRFEEPAAGEFPPSVRTVIHVRIRPKKHRDRRRRDVMEKARQLVMSLKSYLMAKTVTPSEPNEHTPAKADSGVLSRAKSFFSQMVTKSS